MDVSQGWYPIGRSTARCGALRSRLLRFCCFGACSRVRNVEVVHIRGRAGWTGGNRSAIKTVLVAAITTSPRLARRPGNVILPAGTGGLDQESVVSVSQLATVDKEHLVEPLGVLGAGFMRQVDAGLSLVLGL